MTYVLAGSVKHGDSLGNKGKMTAGEVQWMTAGSGILHQEMPKGDKQATNRRRPGTALDCYTGCVGCWLRTLR